MLVNDVLTHMSKKEGVYNYTQIPLKRWSEFQKANITKIVNLDSNINIDNDKDFNEFFIFLNSIFLGRVNKPTAFKIFKLNKEEG